MIGLQSPVWLRQPPKVKSSKLSGVSARTPETEDQRFQWAAENQDKLGFVALGRD